MKPKLGVCYYPEHWPENLWSSDAKRMVETGISVVRIGEFAWSQLEAREGQFTWDWLDHAVDVLSKAGLKIVMSTPSATPPRWVLGKHPDMLAADIKGRPRHFGSRRHYCFSHPGYSKEAARMAGAMAKRYGKHPSILAWQIDNEYGCHETTLSFSENARQGFRRWLVQKYRSICDLNRAWGNVFWSMEYENFDDIDLPNMTVTEASPSHWLDFRRFASSEVVVFNRAQVRAMRPHTNADFIHNYMGRVLDFDHFAVGKDLEIASWDSYPTGLLEQVLYEEEENWKARFSRQGDPDLQAFHHDLYRAVGNGRWWVMEQQPGPVNWASYNPIPMDGMVKLWGMEAIAHGAEVVSYFRWRQPLFAQEQMHAGLLRPDGVNTRAQAEVAALAKEIETLGDIKAHEAKVAIVFDYESQWAWEIQPQGRSFDYFRLVFEQYRALRTLGLSVDVIPAKGGKLGNRSLILIPGLMTWNDGLNVEIANFKGYIIAGPRTGQKTPTMQISSPLGPNFAGARVSRVGSLRHNIRIPLQNGGSIINWIEELETETPRLQTKDGKTVASQNQKRIYLGAWLDKKSYVELFETLCKEAGVETVRMPKALRKREIGKITMLFNYDKTAVTHRGMNIPAASYRIQTR